MKQLFLIAFTIISITFISHAQTIKAIPNGDFESWDSTASFVDLQSPWVSENSLNIALGGKAAVTKVKGQIGYAVKLETYALGKYNALVGVVTNKSFELHIWTTRIHH